MINSDFRVGQPEDIGNIITGVESCLFLITLHLGGSRKHVVSQVRFYESYVRISFGN
jgi:hypothetical protein